MKKRSIRAGTPRIRLFATDVDGTLTDGGMYYTAEGDHMKRFDTRDGMGLALLQAAGVEVAFVTSEDTPIVSRRAEKLRIRHVLMGAKDKVAVVRDLASRLGCTMDGVAYVGDDLNDLEVLQAVGLSFAVADAHSKVREVAHIVLDARGGHGAVREAAERLMTIQRPAPAKRPTAR